MYNLAQCFFSSDEYFIFLFSNVHLANDFQDVRFIHTIVQNAAEGHTVRVGNMDTNVRQNKNNFQYF